MTKTIVIKSEVVKNEVERYTESTVYGPYEIIRREKWTLQTWDNGDQHVTTMISKNGIIIGGGSYGIIDTAKMIAGLNA